MTVEGLRSEKRRGQGCLGRLVWVTIVLAVLGASGAGFVWWVIRDSRHPRTAEGARADSAFERLPMLVASLGDSYSSGEGNPPFDSGTDGLLTGNRCHRSPLAWPRLLGVAPDEHLACSGARIGEVLDGGGDDTGSLSQVERLAGLVPAPEVVFITVGGNDVSISSLVANCYVLGLVEGTCFDSGDRKRTQSVIESLEPRLKELYRAVKQAVPAARLVVVGYPRLFPASGSPAGCDWLDDESLRNFAVAASTLNDVIRRSAEAAGAEFVDMIDALAGHELCTTNSLLYPVVPTGAFTFYSGHPLEAGQRTLASVVWHHFAVEADPDGDGVKGFDDRCPTQPATTSSGCP